MLSRVFPCRFVTASIQRLLYSTGGTVRPEKLTSLSDSTTMGSTLPPLHPDGSNFRLPTHILPIDYKLQVEPNLQTGLFTGMVDILVEVTQPTTYFAVNTKFLEISKTEVTKGTQILAIDEPTENKDTEIYLIPLVNPVSEGQYILHLEFGGNLTSKMVGFYQSTYNEDGQNKYLATTKFEPTYARQAFPCFDEPQLKSTYTISVIHNSAYTALSNTDVVESVSLAGDRNITRFSPSVKMSTYLACFIVSEFGFKEGVTKEGKPIRVYARQQQVDHTSFALDVGIKVYNHYSQYFGIPYVLPKLDMIAIPDFVSGAMENWGLITFRETAILFNPEESSSANQERVAQVVAHEISHQWFGNLVTMKWWDDLWLNEGFASYMEYKGLIPVFPDWHMEDMIIVDDLRPAMDLDAIPSSHPILQHVEHPDKITEIFDTVTYSKGCCVIRMLEQFLGEDNFIKGLNSYLTAFQFQNAETDDLWNHLSQATVINVKDIMDTWTKQMGYPYVTVTVPDPKQPNRLTLKQSRFLSSPAATYNSSESPYGYIWQIPFTYEIAGVKNTVWLKTETETLIVSNMPTDVPVKFNSRFTGFYRVLYDDATWKAFADLLARNQEALEPSDRANLLSDVFTFANAGMLPYNTALNLSSYLNNEDNYVPWEMGYSQLKRISTLLKANITNYERFKTHLLSLAEPVSESLGWEEDSDSKNHSQRLLRILILNVLCENGNATCLQKAAQQLSSWIRGELKITPNFRNLVYRYGMAASTNPADWEYMWKQYLNESDPQEKLKLMLGVASTSNVATLKQLLTYSEDDKLVRGQDVFTLFNFISQNPVGLDVTWDYVRQNWSKLVGRFTLNNRYLGSLIPQIASTFATEERYKQMTDFFAANPEAGAGALARKQALDKIQSNIDWLKENLAQLEQWLDQQDS